MKRWRVFGGLLVIQAALALTYLGVEATREPADAFAWEALDEASPPLSVERSGLGRSSPEAPHIVHFWATWCAPCRAELPSLLAAAEDEGVPLLAVTDEPWPVIAAWFDGEVPDAIVCDPDGQAAARWQVSSLPDTFVVSGGRLIARVDGPRDWSDQAARRFIREVLR